MSTRRTSRGAQVGPPLWAEAFSRILGELQAPVKLLQAWSLELQVAARLSSG